MKKERIFYILVVLITVSLLTMLFVFINFMDTKRDVNTNTTKKTTTTTKEVEKTPEKTIESVYIEGELVEFYATPFESRFGFKTNYDENYFKVNVIGNDTVMFTNLENELNYVKVEKLNETEYYQEYENQINEPKEESEYNYTYSFFRNEGIYLKVTKSIINNPEYDGLSTRMDYIINSIYITKK